MNHVTGWRESAQWSVTGYIGLSSSLCGVLLD